VDRASPTRSLHHSRPCRRPHHLSPSSLSFARSELFAALLSCVLPSGCTCAPVTPSVRPEANCPVKAVVARTIGTTAPIVSSDILVCGCPLHRLSPHPLSKHFKHCTPQTAHAPYLSSRLMRTAQGQQTDTSNTPSPARHLGLLPPRLQQNRISPVTHCSAPTSGAQQACDH
jgi:hypothetical protein